MIRIYIDTGRNLDCRQRKYKVRKLQWIINDDREKKKLNPPPCYTDVYQSRETCWTYDSGMKRKKREGGRI